MQSDTKFHGAASRPPAKARSCGNAYRTRFHRGLREQLSNLLTPAEVSAERASFTAARTAQNAAPIAARWGSLQVRHEVLVSINILRRRHLANTGKEISSAEVVNALMLVGLEGMTRDGGTFAA